MTSVTNFTLLHNGNKHLHWLGNNKTAILCLVVGAVDTDVLYPSAWWPCAVVHRVVHRTLDNIFTV